MRKARVRAVLAAVVLALIGSAVSATPASAGERHFILISSKGAPRWSAQADLYAQNGVKVYHWNQSERSGGRALWYFTWNGDRGWIDIDLKSVDFPTDVITERRLELDRDHCFRVGAFGDNRYTGDSITGGCNSR